MCISFDGEGGIKKGHGEFSKEGGGSESIIELVA